MNVYVVTRLSMRGLFGGGIDVLVSGESGVFPTGLMNPIDVRENLFLA